MRKFALLVLILSLFGGVSYAQPPIAMPPAPMPEFKLPAKKADPNGRFLGRAKPKKQYDYGNYRAVVGSDGKTRYFARLGKSVDFGNQTVPYPASVDWSTKAANVTKRMYLNDQYGCCVLSSRYHQLGYHTAADTGVGLEADDQEVYNAYQSACGRGDNGCDMSAVNQYQQNVGLKVKGVVHKTDASISVDHTNKELVKAAIVVFGGLNVGFSLPNTWYQSNDGAIWDTTNSSIVGGHEVQVYGYDDKYVYLSTWGGYRKWTWDAFLSTRWIDECYATLSADWYGSDKLAPNGIDAVALKAALALIANGQIPPLPEPTPPPGPTPVPPGPNPPPGPTGGYTGKIAIVQEYVDGEAVGKPKTIVGYTGQTSTAVGEELKAAGVSLDIIPLVLKLLEDLKAKKGFLVLLADLMAIINALKSEVAPPVGQVEVVPTPKEVKYGEVYFVSHWLPFGLSVITTQNTRPEGYPLAP